MINTLPQSLIEAAKKILIESASHPMIDVDGIMKHRHNSEGRPIHPSDEGIRNFHKWFGDSKATDEHGRPQVFYHGTTHDFSKFGKEHIGKNFGLDKEGFFFTSKPTVAAGYADSNSQWAMHMGNIDREPKEGSNVLSTYVKIKHPLSLEKYTDMYYTNPKTEIDDAGISITDYFDDNRHSIIHTAMSDKHDGIIFHHKGEKLVIPFEPSQIKSAMGNSGTFHPENAKITESATADLNWAIGDNIGKAQAPYRQKEHQILFVNAHDLLAKQDSNMRVTPDSPENHIGNRMQRAIDHFNKGGYMDPPDVAFIPHNKKYPLGIENGRHRIAASISLGKNIVPIAVHNDDVAEVKKHLNMVNEEYTINEAKETRIPFADISHHHHRKHLNEGKIEDWINHKQPYDSQVNNFNFDTSIDSIRPKTYSTEDTHKDLADDHLSNLDGHHREAVESYIMGGLEDGDETGSFRVNDHLIKSHRAKKEPKKEFHFGQDEDFQRYLNIDDLDDALELNKLDKPLTTYSGIGFNPKDIMKDGNLLHLPAYTSSSTNRGVAVLYSKKDKDNVYHVMQIHHPTGSTGLYIGDRDDFSPFMQKEHIMPRNTTLKVNPKPEVHTDNMGVQMHIWKATRVENNKDK